MRKPGIVILIAVAAVLVTFLVFWVTFDVNHYRRPIQAQLEKRLGRTVTLGEMDLALFPPHFQVRKLVIADDADFENPRPFIEAEQVGVSVRWLPLFRGDVDVSSLNLRRPVIELIKNREGVWNFSSLRPVATPEETAKEPQDGKPLSLAGLSIEDGQVALTDRQAAQPRAVYSNIDLTLKDLTPDKRFSVQLVIHLPGKGTQEVRIEGTGGPIPRGDLAATPFQGALDLAGVRLAALRQFLSKPVLAGSEGTLTGKTTIEIQSGTVTADGEMSIQDARVQTVDLGYPIAAQYTMSSDLKNERLTIKKGTLKLGSSVLSVTGSLDLKPDPAPLGLNVKADNVSLAEVSRLAPAFGMAFSPGTVIKGSLNGEFQARGTTARPAFDGTLSATGVHISGSDIPQPVQIEAVKFRLTPTDIQSDDFNVRSAETTVKSKVALRAYTSETPVVDARLEAPSAQFSAIVAMARAYGLTALDNVTGDGTLSLDLRFAGPVRSLTGDSVLRALHGKSAVAFDNVHISSTNLSKEIAALAGFLKPQGAGRPFTSISKMTGEITIRNGVAQTEDLKATLDLGMIAVRGSADLVNHALNLRVNAVVARRVSQEAGGTGIRGYMKTALANDQGELVVPVLVTGTFENPKVLPDLESFAQMKLKEVLPTSGNPAAGLPRVIGDILMGRSGDQEQQPQKPPEKETPAKGALQQILEGLSEKKQQQEN